MDKVSIKEVTRMVKNIDGDIKTISIIQNNEDRLHFAVYFDDLFYMSGVETEVNNGIKDCSVDDLHDLITVLIDLEDVLVFKFYDTELTEAWKQSYLQGGIEEDRWDRRTIFHKFNDVNELFCIDEITYIQLTDKEYDRRIPNWKKGILEWYKDKIVCGGE